MSGDDQEGHFHIGESEGGWDSNSHLWEMLIFTIQGNRVAIKGKRDPSGILEARRVGKREEKGKRAERAAIKGKYDYITWQILSNYIICLDLAPETLK